VLRAGAEKNGAVTMSDNRADGLSRRRFLAAAAGAAAIGGTNAVFGAAQDDHDDALLRGPKAWLKAILVEYEGKTIVKCEGKGKSCAVLRLVKAKVLSPIHPAALATCTEGINAILDELIAKNTVRSRHPALIVTPYAPFLAWAQTAAAPGTGREITLENNPDRFYQGLGISVAAFKPKPTRFWYCIGGGANVGCKKGGNTQIVARFFTAERPSPIHDATLAEYTNRINAVLDRCDKATRTARVGLSFLVTPLGLFLALSGDDDREGPPPRGAVTAEDSDVKVLQALGI
jgi:hypothetical protein